MEGQTDVQTNPIYKEAALLKIHNNDNQKFKIFFPTPFHCVNFFTGGGCFIVDTPPPMNHLYYIIFITGRKGGKVGVMCDLFE